MKKKKNNFDILKILFITIIIKGIIYSCMCLNYYSSIVIKISGFGPISIINEQYIQSIKEIYIDEEKQNEIKNIYQFNSSIGFSQVRINFADSMDNCCNEMFYNLKNIIEIDLSGFKTNNATTMEKMFGGCGDLTSINFDNFNTASVKNMNYLFDSCTRLTFANINIFNTKVVSTMEGMFKDCHSLITIDLSYFNTENLNCMKKMFYYCYNLQGLIISNFDTSKVTDMSFLFAGCMRLNSIDLSNFNTSSVIRMDNMFSNCQQITTLNFKTFNTSMVESMSHMFEYCINLVSLDLSYFDTSFVKNMNSMFSKCEKLQYFNFEITDQTIIQKNVGLWCEIRNILSFFGVDECHDESSIVTINNFHTFNVTDMGHMFSSCSSLVSLNISHFNTSCVTNMEYMFADCKKLESIYFGNIDTSKVKNMNGLFKGCSIINKFNFSIFNTDSLKSISRIFEDSKNLTSFNLKIFDTKNVEDMSYMFNSCKDLVYIDLSYINTSSATNLNGMISNCNNLLSFNFKNLDTSKVTTMNGFFQGCSALESIDLSDFKTSSLKSINYIFSSCQKLIFVNFSNFDTSNIEDISYMFSSCTSLQSIDLSGLKTSSVIYMNNLFDNCHNLVDINLNNIDTSNVQDINHMFSSCYQLSSINLSHLNTISVIKMNNLFENCHNLVDINLNNIDTSNVQDISYMFKSCVKLVSFDLSHLKTFSVTKMNNLFENCENIADINLNNIDTSKVQDISYMFSSCYNLTYINLSHFNTSLVNKMNNLFYNCQKLEYLDLSNFKTDNVKDMSSMFSNCFNITSIELSNFETKNVENMKYMFYNCNKLNSLNLANFITHAVKDMSYMFSGCYLLKSLDLIGFYTCNVENMEHMFNQCYSLVSLNLTIFNTSKVTDMKYMFNECNNLQNLEIINFNTSNVKDMQFMFNDCINLTSLDLSIFKTSKSTNMQNMFNNCKNIKYLDLSSFKTGLLTNMENMFSGCENLLFLDLSNFNISLVTGFKSMFKNCLSLIYINFPQFEINGYNEKYDSMFDNNANNTQYCLKSLNPDILSYYNKTINCSHICFNEKSSIIVEKRICIEKCENDLDYKYEYNKKCFEKCPNGTHSSFNDEFICEDDFKCPEFNINNSKCEQDAQFGYYMDISDGIYRACYKTCKKCYGPGNEENNNCMECIPNYQLLKESFKEKNCFKICDHNYYFDKAKNYYCTENSNCTSRYSKYIENKKKCIRTCKNDNIYQYEYDNLCYIQCPNGTISRSYNKICKDIDSISTDTIKADIEEKEKAVSSFREDLLSGDMDDIVDNLINNGEDFEQNEDNLKLQLTTSENQKNTSNKNISSIDLGECEYELKRIYEINETLPLIILKYDYYINDTLIPMVGYELYHPINKTQLNLEYCKEYSIKMNLPVIIDEGKIYKYDPNSKYYTDKCNSYTTENGTDIILNDRIIEYGNNNLSLCENNCNFVAYSTINKNSECGCEIKIQMEKISQIVDNPNKLSNEFSTNQTSTSSSSNILAIKCTKVLFTKDGLINNISNYVLSIIIFYFLLSTVLFIKCGYSLLKDDIDKIIKKKVKKGTQIKKSAFNKKLINTKKRKLAAPNKRLTFKLEKERIRNKRYNLVPSSNPNYYIKNFNIINNITKNTSSIIIPTKKKIVPKLNKIIKPNFNDYEFNTLIYKDAIKFDRRTCFEYYKSLLKLKHPIIFGFCPYKDYNTIIIKSCIFFLSFSIYYAMNFVFFDDDVIHKLYVDEGNYDFLYFLPQILISFTVSHTLTVIIKLLFLSERNIAELNFQPNGNKVYYLSENVRKYLVIKYSIFFISGIIFLAIFWLFLSAFGAVYQNTQIVVFENTLISFAISFVYPIFINVIPSLLRISSLSNKDNDSECLYNISKYLQII